MWARTPRELLDISIEGAPDRRLAFGVNREQIATLGLWPLEYMNFLEVLDACLESRQEISRKKRKKFAKAHGHSFHRAMTERATR